MKNLQSVTGFLQNKTILITGATGYIGKVLLEKLLRDCTGIKRIYVLLRHSDNSTEPTDKLGDLKSHRIFNNIRAKDVNILDKVHGVAGDLKESGLKMSDKDMGMLVKEVNIVFHCGANVSFSQSIRDAIRVNTRGTKELVRLAKRMENLSAFVYMSTAYSNANHKYIHEIIYNEISLTTSVYDYKTVLNACDTEDSVVINFIERTIIPNVYPNSYVYSKNLAENIVYDASYEIPVCIVRPSVVAPAVREPQPGWADNLNGPVEVFMAGASGLLRTVHGIGDIVPDLIPVDYAVNSLIVAASHIGQRKQNDVDIDVGVGEENGCSIKNRCPIFNCTVSKEAGAKWSELIEIAHKVSQKTTPLDHLMWNPSTVMVSNYAVYLLSFIIFQYIPALFIDTFLFFIRRTPFLLKIQEKMFNAVSSLSFYLCKQWQWDNRQLRQLYADLSSNEKYTFNFDANKIDYHTIMSSWVSNAKNLLLENDCKNLTESKRNSQKLYWIDSICKTILSSAIIFAILYFVTNKYFRTIAPMTVGGEYDCESCARFDIFSARDKY